MDKKMLRKGLWEILKPLIQLIQNLLNPEKGEEWEREFKRFLRKDECWKKYIIDCDAQPFIPEGWSVEEHRTGGNLEWDPEKVSFYLFEHQKVGEFDGHELRKELANKSVLNACVLDYLLANKHLIPKELKGKCVSFWGTIYRDDRDSPCVRYLFCNGTRWKEGFGWLANGWGSNDNFVACWKELPLTA